ncbi:hypothetical protein [Candidatus Poriferisocius sp.]|uniref:hypothetical protein n=1 Tax=Candidatus Poriferisocius sp. TaxID=3101276 RepID=UPI003B52FE7A
MTIIPTPKPSGRPRYADDDHRPEDRVDAAFEAVMDAVSEAIGLGTKHWQPIIDAVIDYGTATSWATFCTYNPEREKS